MEQNLFRLRLGDWMEQNLFRLRLGEVAPKGGVTSANCISCAYCSTGAMGKLGRRCPAKKQQARYRHGRSGVLELLPNSRRPWRKACPMRYHVHQQRVANGVVDRRW